jgi:hypothetical protein
MKISFYLAGLLLTTSSFSQSIYLKDFKDWTVTDISSLGHKKEKLFSQMNDELVKIGGSICSNRAMVWAWDFKRFYQVDAAKIFLFYTQKKAGFGEITWWYHVAPVVNEKGSLYVMDAGFPGYITRPTTIDEWLESFAKSTRCKEIQANETELIERMFDGYVFPKKTSFGTYDCYYKITPAGYWTPTSVAQGLLGVDENGKKIDYVRDTMDIEEVFEACTEAVTSKLGWAMGAGKSKCKKYLGLPDSFTN